MIKELSAVSYQLSAVVEKLRAHRKAVLFVALALVALGAFFVLAHRVYAAPSPNPTIVMPSIKIEGKQAGPKLFGQSIWVLILFSFLSLAPYLLMMMTSFVRVIIVLSFIRSALGTQQVPPTQVLMGLALFITMYIMAPVGRQINEQVIVPVTKGQLPMTEAVGKGSGFIRDFMLRQVQKEDLALFFDLAKLERPKTREDVPMHVLMPAFMISEIKIGFEIGFLIYIPFLIIDMVVASVLMSMGMFMLSPMTISLPFKLLLFVMVDGWELVVKGLVVSFH